MRRLKPTLVDTIHVLAAITVLGLLIAFVIAQHEPEWTDFILHSAAVLAGNVVLARIINGLGRR
jgi:Na+-translocating ferredoxin:NAD+ oxidoreductase RnfD subunit